MANAALNHFAFFDANRRHQEAVLREIFEVAVVGVGYFQVLATRDLLNLKGVLTGFQGSVSVRPERKTLFLIAKGRVTQPGEQVLVRF